MTEPTIVRYIQGKLDTQGHHNLNDTRLPLIGILPDHEIRKCVKIEPWAEGEKRPGKISWGLSSMGYDIRLGYKFKIFSPTLCTVVDPKAVDERAFVNIDLTPRHYWRPYDRDDVETCSLCSQTKTKQNFLEYCSKSTQLDHILIPPNAYALGEALEWIEMPEDVIAICLGKSTYARVAIAPNLTPLEPEWKGRLTLEISNLCSLPVKIYAGEGACQFLFLRGDQFVQRKPMQTRQMPNTKTKLG